LQYSEKSRNLKGLGLRAIVKTIGCVFYKKDPKIQEYAYRAWRLNSRECPSIDFAELIETLKTP
jgi:hypothetical protein